MKLQTSKVMAKFNIITAFTFFKRLYNSTRGEKWAEK